MQRYAAPGSERGQAVPALPGAERPSSARLFDVGGRQRFARRPATSGSSGRRR